jgi:hypothetical protein
MFFDQFNVPEAASSSLEGQPGSSDTAGSTDTTGSFEPTAGSTDTTGSFEPTAGSAYPGEAGATTDPTGPGWPTGITNPGEAGATTDPTGPGWPTEFAGLTDPAGSTAANEELVAPAGPAESPTTEAPVSFIRESWLHPPAWIPATESKTPGTGTRPLPLAFRPESGRTDGWPRRTVMAVGAVLVGLIAILGFVSVHNGQVAAKWQQRDAAQVALTQQVSAQLAKANDHITTLDGTVGSLQGQLATATSKQKANSGVSGVLHRLLWPFG